MSSFTRKNRGKFNISDNFFTDYDLSDLATIFSKLEFIPTRVEHLYAERQFEYFGFSPNFEEVEDHYVSPVYNVVVTLSKDVETGESIMNVSFSKAS